MKKRKIATLFFLVVFSCSCLLMGCGAEKDPGLQVYEKVSAFLPENAIENIEKYETMDNEKDGEPIAYVWAEEPYILEGEDASGKYAYTQQNEDGSYTTYIFKRALNVSVDNLEDLNVRFLVYNNSEIDETKEPSLLATNKMERDAYVQNMAKTLLADGDNLNFIEAYVVEPQDGVVKEAYYTCTFKDETTGNITQEWVILLDCYHGHLSGLTQIDYVAMGLETQKGIEEQFELMRQYSNTK